MQASSGWLWASALLLVLHIAAACNIFPVLRAFIIRESIATDFSFGTCCAELFAINVIMHEFLSRFRWCQCIILLFAMLRSCILISLPRPCRSDQLGRMDMVHLSSYPSTLMPGKACTMTTCSQSNAHLIVLQLGKVAAHEPRQQLLADVLRNCANAWQASCIHPACIF